MSEKKVLVVDDDKIIRTLIGNVLEKEGWSFISVEGGADALEVVEEYKPDVITLDYIMPDLTGIEVFEEINRRGLDIPIVFLTVSKEDKLIKDFLRLGAFGYLTKPFRATELIFILTKAFHYKILKENLYGLENMEMDFKGLHEAISNLDRQGIDTELARRILVDRQKTYQISNFYNFYKSRRHRILEQANNIESLSVKSRGDNDECNRAIKEFKTSMEDLNNILEMTEEGLEEILIRQKNPEK